MKLQTAQRIAQRLVERMKPHCHRIEVAGSVRRQVPDVGDIEIVAIPKTYQEKIEKKQGDMFGPQYELIERSELVDGALVSIPNITWVKTSFTVKRLEGTTGLKQIPDAFKLQLQDELSAENFYGRNRKHWKGISAYKGKPFQVDLFLTDKNRFGATHLIRTGSAEFNQKLIHELKQHGYGFANGDFVRYKYAKEMDEVADIVYCPDEVVIFKQLGMSVVPPEERDRNYEF